MVPALNPQQERSRRGLDDLHVSVRKIGLEDSVIDISRSVSLFIFIYRIFLFSFLSVTTPAARVMDQNEKFTEKIESFSSSKIPNHSKLKFYGFKPIKNIPVHSETSHI